MKLNRVVMSLGLITLVGAGSARADYKDFLNYCTPGAIRSCASFQIITTALGSGGTSVVIRVRNLQHMTAWNGGNTGGSLITRIGLVAPQITGASGLTVAAVGGAATTGSPSGYWSLNNPGGLGGQIELTAGILAGTFNGGIRGCSNPFSGAPANMFRTCQSTMPNGWVEFAFTTTNAWSATQAEVAFLSGDYKNFQGTFNECDTQAGAPRADCVQVTPEPITMVLLGTGMAGLGGAGLIRRRKGVKVESV